MVKKRNPLQRLGIAVFYFFLRYSVGLVLLLIFRVRHKKGDIYRKIHPPYVVLSNHTSPYDPFWINLGIRPPIHWVVSDANLRTRFMKFLLLNVVGCIPKTKETSDLETIVQLKAYAENKEVIGIFPEGEQTWTGETAPIIPSTSKLLRFLKIPVVIPVVKGGYSVWPRWSWHKRGKDITIEHKLLFSADEIKKANLKEIEEKLENALYHNEFEYQKINPVKLGKHKRAENVELALFLCPSCYASGTLRSRDNLLRCKECDMEAEIDQNGFFRYNTPSQALRFNTVKEWIEWQEENCRFRVRNEKGNLNTPLFPPDTDIILSCRNRRGRSQRQGKGRALFFGDRIEFQFNDQKVKIFPLETIKGMGVHKQQQVEFSDHEAIWHFDFPAPWISGYKWLTFFRILQAEKIEEKHA